MSFKFDRYRNGDLMAERIEITQAKTLPDAAARAAKMADAGEVLVYTPDPLNLPRGMTLAQWRVFARRDDCLEQMVPSDLRVILAAIKD